MYNSSNVADTIKKEAKNKNISVKQVLERAGLGANTMSNFKTSMPKADNLAKIADILGCSVDYLLGRVDSAAELIKRTPQNAVNCLDSLIEKNALSEKEKTIINIFRSLNLEGQDIVFNTIQGIEESGRYKKRSELSEEIS